MKMNMQNMMQQAQKFQEEMEKVKKEIAAKTVTADAGGGMVTVEMTGNNQVVSLKISKDAADANDMEMLEDLIIAAVNKATQEAAEMSEREMQKVTGMLPNIPGLNLGF